MGEGEEEGEYCVSQLALSQLVDLSEGHLDVKQRNKIDALTVEWV